MIEFRNVSKVYPNGTTALKNISLHVKKGEFVFVVGSSGSGKSTFLKLIMHEEEPSCGEIFIDGVNTTNLAKKQIPYLPRVIGVVTSPTGAVIRDIIHRVSDRFPTRIIVWPTPVQG